ncbi:MAG: tetracycline resistance MFS efflux pump [Chloroflexi bacterium HGW-Chloroflexi-10]|nr:MAG: tetracycline resistance MFS efflux pump [Chloroflexi bacterium HGW-Chloroflexi-10]
MKSTNKKALSVIFFIMLMDIIGLSILGPVAPYIVKQYSGNALTVTMLSAIYAGAMFFAAPIMGKISDRIGRRQVLLASVFGSAIGYFIFGIGGALWVLFLSRLIDGVTGGNMSTAAAYIADVSKPEERAKNFTLIGMAYGIGFILGPALGGALGQININLPLFAAGIIALISVSLIYFLLPESLPVEKRETAPLKLKDFNPFVAIYTMARKPGIGLLLLVTALFYFVFDGINSTMGVFIIDKFSALPWTIGLFFVISGIATAIMQATLVRTMVPKYGEKRMAIAALLGEGLGALFIFLTPVFWMLFPIAFFQSAVVSFIFSTLSTLTANRVSEREQGQLAGVNVAISGLMAALGPLWAGAVYDYVIPGAPFWMGAILLGIACMLMAMVKVKAYRQHSVPGISPAAD